MKKIFIVQCCVLFLLSSCIKSEGVDREADIVSFSITGDNIITSLLRNDIGEIYIMVDGKYLENFEEAIISPKIEMSTNAAITPASEEEIKLSNYTTIYNVRAENGGERTYLVTVIPYVPLNAAIKMDFEEWFEVTTSLGYVYELPSDPLWVNANEGVAKLYRANTPFPTRKSTDKYPESDGNYSGVLETVEGNSSIVNIMNIPVYAGNMYRGLFDASVATKDPLATTKFGQIHPKSAGKPLKIKAWYKYLSGKDGYTTWVYVGKRKSVSVIPGQLDKPDVYAVLYKVPKGEAGKDVFLTANDIKTSDKIVATAFLEDTTEKNDWTKLDLLFTYREELDYTKNDYKLTVVLSSSFDGGNYRGAIGSILTVDDLEVVCEDIE